MKITKRQRILYLIAIGLLFVYIIYKACNQPVGDWGLGYLLTSGLALLVEAILIIKYIIREVRNWASKEKTKETTENKTEE